MNTHKAKEMAQLVITNGKISQSDAAKIIKLLKPRDLAKFMKILKRELEKETIHITSAIEVDAKTVHELQAVFKSKIAIQHVDEKIGAGLSVQAYDMIYDLSVKSEIERLAQRAEEEL